MAEKKRGYIELKHILRERIRKPEFQKNRLAKPLEHSKIFQSSLIYFYRLYQPIFIPEVKQALADFVLSKSLWLNSLHKKKKKKQNNIQTQI